MTEHTQVAPVVGAKSHSPAPSSRLDDLAAAHAEIEKLRARLNQALIDVGDLTDTMNWQRREIGKLRASIAMMEVRS